MKNPSENLPEEMLIEIFSRLPPKSVGRFRLLSKKWSTNLSTSQFINLLLANRMNRPENHLLLANYNSIHVITTQTGESKKLDLGKFTPKSVRITSCNGLALLSNNEDGMILVNPITLQNFKVPNLLSEDRVLGWYCVGLGYDNSTDDYKIVTITIFRHGDSDCRSIDVYSVKSGVWKQVSFGNWTTVDCSGGFTNGALHWLSVNDASRAVSIVAFNLADEVFREIPFPTKYVGEISISHDVLCVLGGCLCMVNSYDNYICVMKEYGSVDSWTKIVVEAKDEVEELIPLCFSDDKEIVLMADTGYVVHNLQNGTTKHITIGGVQSHFRDGVAFVDTLFFPAKLPDLV